jgi:hypothetical protein
MHVELITWRDAGGDEADHVWASEAEVSDDNPIIVSVGWVVKETANNITLAMDRAEDNTTHTRSRIPIGMIVNRTILFKQEGP